MNSTNATVTYIPSSVDYGLIGIQGIMFALDLIISFGLILFRNKQPLKSRGFTPLIGMTLFSLAVFRVMFETFGYFNIKEATSVTRNFPCYWFILAQAPVMIIFVLITLANMIRYITTEQLQKAKDNAWNLHLQIKDVSNEKEDAMKSLEKFVRIAKICLSGWLMIPIVFGAVVVWVVIEVIIVLIGGAIAQETCTMTSSKGFVILAVMQGVNLGIYVLVAIVTLIFFVTDIVIFARQNGFSPLQYFREDPLFFRLEYIFTFIWVFAATLLITGVFFVQTQQQWSILVVLSVLEGVGLFCCGGFLLGVTIFHVIRNTNHTVDPTSIRDVIKDKLGREKLFEFTRREWSSENLMAFIEIQDIKQIRIGGQSTTSELQMKKTKDLVDMYFKTGACIEVNLPGEVKKDLLKGVGNNDGQVGIVEILDPVEKELLANLKDTFFRWSRTGEYTSWASKHLANGRPISLKI
jgi:hypothetical protein